MAHVRVESVGNLEQDIVTATHRFPADEPREAGGQDAGPNPYELLLGALGACTSMTLLLYARRKGIQLDRVAVELDDSHIYAQDCRDCETKEGHITGIRRRIHLEGALSDEQRARLMEIAAKCPVHRTLSAEIKIRDESM